MNSMPTALVHTRDRAKREYWSEDGSCISCRALSRIYLRESISMCVEFISTGSDIQYKEHIQSEYGKTLIIEVCVYQLELTSDDIGN